MKILLLILALFSYSSFALNIKIRAREHFEAHTLKLSNKVDTKFSGFSNTINIWHEIPYKYSFGLSLSPVIGKLKANDQLSENAFKEKVNFKAFGFEGKFFLIDSSIYLRQGVYAHEFDKLAGWGTLTTVGYEHPFSKFGLALEGGYRWYSFGEEKGTAQNIAIGFHFYNN